MSFAEKKPRMEEKHFMFIWKNSALCLVVEISFIWTHTMLHNRPCKKSGLLFE